MIVGSINHPGTSPFVAGTKAGSPLGFIFTIFVCPGLTMIATAGFVRSFIIRQKSGV